jgi:hypothetical protein
MSVDLAGLSSLTFGSTSISVPKSVATLYNDFTPSIPCPPRPAPSRMSISFHIVRVPLVKLLLEDTATLQGGSPSSTMTLRRPDASPRAPPPVDATLRRRSNRISRWLLELQTSTPPDVIDLSDVDPVGTRCNPYLAYPHLSMAALRRSLDDADSMHDYVVVDDDIALECPAEDSLYDQVRNLGLLVDRSPDVPT